MGVLSDWRDGRIVGWVEAPGLEVAGGGEGGGDGVGGSEGGKGEGGGGGDRKEIVREWSREFRIEGLWGGDEGGRGGVEAEVEVEAKGEAQAGGGGGGRWRRIRA